MADIGNVILIMNLVYCSIIAGIFFIKKKTKNIETKLYSILMISTLGSIILEMLSGYFIKNLPNNEILAIVVNKLHISNMCLWITIFTLYVMSLTFGIDKLRKRFHTSDLTIHIISLCLILSLIAFLLPLNFYNDGTYIYTTGLAPNLILILGAIYMVLDVVGIILNKQRLNIKKLVPLIILLLGFVGIIIIRNISPGLVLMSMVFSIVVVIMYHTIENPDVKMLMEVENARDLAEKANRAKSDFLSSMSHEIRTPLNAIVGLSEDNLNYQDKCPKEVIENCNDVLSASQTLLEIVGNILDINKIESEKMEVKEIEYNFKEEIEKLARIDATRIGEKPIDFKIKIAEDIPEYLYGDKNHMKQIVNNLLSNAIKYTNEGTILFTVKCINKDNICHLFISVQDTGIGIKAENIKKLFTKFERLDVERNTTTEGTGLGLAITKKLVNMMGGKINVESQFGKGSIFMVTIPQKIIYKEPTYETFTIHSANTIENKNIEKTIQENTAIVEQTNTKVDIENKKRILVVDDNNLNIKVAKKALEEIDIIVESVMSGNECLEKIKNGEQYDVILMDIMMPEMSGETTLKKLKEDPNFNTPVIAVTADAMADAEEKYINEGFIAYGRLCPQPK